MSTMTETVIHPLEEKPQKPAAAPGKPLPVMLVLFVFVAIIAGSGSGYVLAQVLGGKSIVALPGAKNSAETTEKKENSFGQKNTKLFPDSAEGTLKLGGVDGEGTHHLVRPGGKSQNVYLTSSSVDLSALVGKKVKVWGKTYAAQTAGWLMDVGYLEVE